MEAFGVWETADGADDVNADVDTDAEHAAAVDANIPAHDNFANSTKRQLCVK